MTLDGFDLGYLLEVRPWFSLGTISGILILMAFGVIYYTLDFFLRLFQIVVVAVSIKAGKRVANKYWSKTMVATSVSMGVSVIFYAAIMGGVMTFFQSDISWHLTSGFRWFPIEEMHLVIFNIAMIFAVLSLILGFFHILRISGPWFLVVTPVYIIILIVFVIMGFFAGPLGLLYLYHFLKYDNNWVEGVILPFKSGIAVVMNPSLIRDRPHDCLLMVTPR